MTSVPPTLDELTVAVERPDDDVRAAAHDQLAGRGSSGRLAEVAEWLAAVQGRAPAVVPERVRLVVVADEVPARTARVAADVGVEVRTVRGHGLSHALGHARSHALGHALGRVEVEDACSRDEASAAFFAGAAVADEEADSGTDLLAVALPDPALAVPAASLVGLLTRSDASAVTATGQSDADWMVACAATRDAMRRGRPLLAEQLALLATVGGEDLAFVTGLLLRAAGRRTPVVLDGPVSAAAAMVAARLAFRAPAWWLAGSLSPDPGHRLALERLSLDPVLDLGLRADDGTGALLAVPVLRAAVAG